MMYPSTDGGPGADIAVVDQGTIARARYLGYMRRSMPPRCSPISIVIIVLALGMLFIGITMTLIANWPGATTIGENPLKIAGPILLALGGAVLILGIVFAGMWSKRERSKWEKSITDFAAQRSVSVRASSQQLITSTAYPYSDQPSSEGQRKSILRTSKSSGAEEGYYDNSGKAYPVEGLPEAMQHVDEAADLVPDPVRIRKSRSSAAHDRSGVGSSSGSEIGAADLGSIGVYSPPTRGRQNGGNGGYTNGAYVPQVGPDMQRREGDEDEWRGGRQKRGREAYQGEGFQGVPMEQQRLHLHIRAQPGAAVHITPSATPPVATPPHSGRQRGYPSVSARQLDDSAAETEI